MKFRPLGEAEKIIQGTGLNITYAYDDLVFVEHNPFLIQFDDENTQNLNLFFNIDCEADASQIMERQLNEAAGKIGFSITKGGKFEMTQKEGTEEVEIKFIQ